MWCSKECDPGRKIPDGCKLSAAFTCLYKSLQETMSSGRLSIHVNFFHNEATKAMRDEDKWPRCHTLKKKLDNEPRAKSTVPKHKTHQPKPSQQTHSLSYNARNSGAKNSTVV